MKLLKNIEGFISLWRTKYMQLHMFIGKKIQEKEEREEEKGKEK